MEWDSYKWTMPTTRFMGYLDFMTRATKKESPHQKKVKELMKNMTPEEYEKYYG